MTGRRRHRHIRFISLLTVTSQSGPPYTLRRTLALFRRASSVSMDIIGKRGEALFRVAITKWCGGEQWFEETFKGEKAEGLDFEVTLLRSPVFHASFYVQVKATAKPNRYSGVGKRRKIRVALRTADARKLGTMKVPVYVVGIDVLSGKAHIKHVKAGASRGFNGISTRRPLNCRAIRQLWHEVEAFWKSRPEGLTTSAF